MPETPVVKEPAEKLAIPRKTITTELIVGVFCLVGLLCLAYLSLNVARMRFWRAGYYGVLAEFDNVAGLKLGAPVEIAGVGVGEVTKITLNKTSAVVSLDIRDGVELRDDDIAAIRTKGIIGDRYIKVIPGGSEIIIAKQGSLTQTESAVELEEMLGKFIHQIK